MSPNAGSTKWRLRWGSFRGSSLNLGWSKHGIWWVDQWVPFSWLHIESFDIIRDMRGYYIHLGFNILIMMIWLSWLGILIPWFLLCFIDIFDWDIDMLDYWWLILLLCLARWPWFCHDCSDHFTCMHSLLYIIRLDMLIHLLVYYFDHLWACCLCITIHLIVVFSIILCVYIDDISEICLIVCRMTALLLHDRVPLVYVGRISIPLSPIL